MTTMTTILEPDLPLLRTVLRRESARVADGLRGGDTSPLSRQVPGLDWSAGEVAAHLSVVYGAFAATLRDADQADGSSPEGGSALQRTLAGMNAAGVEAVRFATPEEAADALRAAAQELLTALDGDLDLSSRRPTPWYGPGAALPVAALAALSVTETLVHGHDLDRALGRRARIAADAAAAAAPTVMSTMLPLLLDRDRAGDRRLAFELRIRGGRPFVLRIADGRAWSEPVAGGGAPVDCVLSLTGEAALLTGFARRPVWRSIASGAAFSWGRRPWLGPRFHTLFVTV